MTSTLSDYLKLLQFFLRNIKSSGARNTISLMFKNQIGDLNLASLKSYNRSLALDYKIHPNVKNSWGYGVIINGQPLAQGRSAGSGSWAGVLNTYFWIDHKNDIAGVFLTHILNCYSHWLLKAFESFEELFYRFCVKR